MTVNPPTPHGRRARRDGPAHPHVAVCRLAGALIMLASSLGASYAGPTLGTWVFGGLALAFAVLFVVALLLDGGKDDEVDPWACPECGNDASRECPTYCSRWQFVSDSDDEDDEREQDEDARWYGGAS